MACTITDYLAGALELHCSLWGCRCGGDWARASLDAWQCWYGPFGARCKTGEP